MCDDGGSSETDSEEMMFAVTDVRQVCFFLNIPMDLYERLQEGTSKTLSSKPCLVSGNKDSCHGSMTLIFKLAFSNFTITKKTRKEHCRCTAVGKWFFAIKLSMLPLRFARE